MVAISYDTPEVIRHAAERLNITYPLLSDPDSKIIRALGILNPNIPEDHEWYGVPFPGMYIVDTEGIVQSKYFEEDHRERYTANSILTREYGVSGGRRVEVQTDHLKLTAYPSENSVRGGNRITLVIEIELPEKMHIYAPGVEGYKPAVFSIDENSLLRSHGADFPDAEILHLPAINERVPVYQHQVLITQDVTVSPRARGPELIVRGSFEYQACDDKICYLPTTVPCDFEIEVGRHDVERAPAALRRKGPGG